MENNASDGLLKPLSFFQTNAKLMKGFPSQLSTKTLTTHTEMAAMHQV